MAADSSGRPRFFSSCCCYPSALLRPTIPSQRYVEGRREKRTLRRETRRPFIAKPLTCRFVALFTAPPQAQTALRAKLLSRYDRGSVPPTNNITAEARGNATAEYPFEPLLIEAGLNFHRVLDVDVVKSAVDLLVWIRVTSFRLPPPSNTHTHKRCTD